MPKIKPQGSYVEQIKGKENKQLKKYRIMLIIMAVILIFTVGITVISVVRSRHKEKIDQIIKYDIPMYNGELSVVLNDNLPYFSPEEYKNSSFEEYSNLDEYGRCGTAFANVCTELMPTEARKEIGYIKPSGWQQEKYPGLVDSEPPYLYNRCHLIGYQLTGENDNEKNLITGTRYFNVEGMLPFENAVRNYIDMTGNHVLYRVTPVYEGKNLLASGVIIEAWSVEDAGKGLSFNVFVYNVQPGVAINYEDGSSRLE